MKTSLVVVKEQLFKNDVFLGFQSDCEQYLSNPQICEKLKFGFQQLMNQWTIMVKQVLIDEDMAILEISYYQVQILISASSMTPLVINVPSMFPFKGTKVVPQSYGSTVNIHGQKQEDKAFMTNEAVVNIIGTGGMTISDRVFASVPPEKNNVEASTKGKGKQTANTDQGKNPTLNKSPLKDVDEFLQIIKISDYKVVEQLNHTP